MRFNLIYRLKQNEVGSGRTAVYMAKTYPDLFSSYEYHDSSIPEENRVWRLQNPYFYKTSCITRINDIVMLRKQFTEVFPGRHIIDGYSYYRNNISKYEAWFPTIYQSDFDVSQIPCIGYYARDCRLQSNNAFADFVGKLPADFPVVTMGTKECIENGLAGRKNWRHTYDNADFWRSCSHYFYYRCSDFEDPFPMNLLEAIQSKHRIISPKDMSRTHTDGIDDFLSCIDYDTDFIESNTGKYCEELQSSTWESYMIELTDSRFARNRIIYNEKTLLYDWICRFLR